MTVDRDRHLKVFTGALVQIVGVLRGLHQAITQAATPIHVNVIQ
jgi:hypothetical protein